MEDLTKLRDKVSRLEKENEELISKLKYYENEKEVFIKTLKGYCERLDEVLTHWGIDNEFFIIGDRYYTDIEDEKLKECYKKLCSNRPGGYISKTRSMPGILSGSQRKLKTR